MKLNQVKAGTIPTFSQNDVLYIKSIMLFSHYTYKMDNPLEIQLQSVLYEQLEKIAINYLTGVKDAIKPSWFLQKTI